MGVTGSNRPATSPLAALLLLLLADLLLGIWLKLHRPQGLPYYFLINAPTLGLTSLVWRLLPKPVLEGVGEQVAVGLTSKAVRYLLIIGMASLAAASLFFGAIHVSLVDPGTTAMVHVVRGSQRDAHPNGAVPVDSFRLDRLTSSIVNLQRIKPFGETFWLYTSSHVLYRDARTFAWWPAEFAYPADFVAMSGLAVLPTPWIIGDVVDKQLRFTLRDQAGADLASTELNTNPRIISYLPYRPIGEDRVRWSKILDSMGGQSLDTTSRNFTLRLWNKPGWLASALPLRSGDSLNWEVRSLVDSTFLVRGGIRLDAKLADLPLSF